MLSVLFRYKNKGGTMRISFITLVWFSLQLTACGLLQRHENSEYYDSSISNQNSLQSFYRDRNRHNESKARQELGYEESQILSESEINQLKTRLYLKRLESQLRASNEKKQYYHYKPMLKNDEERINFLNIRSVEGRERWAQTNNIDHRQQNFDRSTLKLIEKNDLALGMSRSAVKESWGDPDTVQVAGNEIYGNQAWKYNKMISSEDGYKKETRVIYFEAGRVVGWETF